MCVGLGHSSSLTGHAVQVCTLYVCVCECVTVWLLCSHTYKTNTFALATAHVSQQRHKREYYERSKGGLACGSDVDVLITSLLFACHFHYCCGSLLQSPRP